MKHSLPRGLALAGMLVLLLAGFATPAAAQKKLRDAIIVMKDGFVLKGKVVQLTEFIVDPASGASFTIPKANGFYYIDDGVRRIAFSPRQVAQVIDDDPEESRLMTLIKGGKLAIGDSFLPDWRIESIGDFNEKWERSVRIVSLKGKFDVTQRVTVLTPRCLRVDSLRIDWIPRYFTKELGPQRVHALVKDHLAKQEMNELEKQKNILQFLFQTGWYDYTAAELKSYLERFPDQRSRFVDLENKLAQVQALAFFEELEQAHKAGLHKETQRRIEHLQKSGMAKLLGKELFRMQEIKNETKDLQEKFDQATAYLKAMPTFVNALNRDLFKEAAAGIASELSYETLPRLELFAVFAQQFARDVKEGRAPKQSADEVLSLAISGWLQGNNAASPEVATAASLWQARKMVLEYLGTSDAATRTNTATVFANQHKLSVDVIARMLPMLPPASPHKVDVTGQPIELTPEAGNGQGAPYTVQLPAEYSPNRPYPVLLLLHSLREQPGDMLARFRDLAARHGYILAAPAWAQMSQLSYEYSQREHDAVINTVRDLRRRFNVDSDRVFLFGFEDGATAAFDIGLSHPHEFAGVLPMSGDPSKLPTLYWPNAQYLPFYVVDGGFSGESSKANNELFKKWIRYGYPAFNVEYKGRMGEWFAAELPYLFDWMARKKRANPISQLGIQGEEFCTARAGDDHYYWIGTSDISPTRLYDFRNPRVLPATMEARIATGNELIKKADGAAANIWNQINIRTSGLGNVIVRFGPNMIDFTKPVLFRINAQQFGRPQNIQPSLETMLEEVYRSGDRQRLYYARVEVKLR